MVTYCFRWLEIKGSQSCNNVVRLHRQDVSFLVKLKQPLDTYDIEGTIVQRGSTEYLLTNGKARVLRRLIGNRYEYSRLGKQYFQHKKTAYLVHVPAVTKNSFQPIERQTLYGSS